MEEIYVCRQSDYTAIWGPFKWRSLAAAQVDAQKNPRDYCTMSR
jgi:hypothetical protein